MGWPCVVRWLIANNDPFPVIPVVNTPPVLITGGVLYLQRGWMMAVLFKSSHCFIMTLPKAATWLDL